MWKHEDVKKCEARATAFADEFIAEKMTGLDQRVMTLFSSALRIGWMSGYTVAMNDVVAMRSVAGAVKH